MGVSKYQKINGGKLISFPCGKSLNREMKMPIQTRQLANGYICGKYAEIYSRGIMYRVVITRCALFN